MDVWSLRVKNPKVCVLFTIFVHALYPKKNDLHYIRTNLFHMYYCSNFKPV